ncbi:hypothetical protein HKX48_004263 [Thoreauomyces humboldtii]|nr:hypothetical protein HKX48_004263 [Thoreauomyces humboldtii]
MTSRLASRRRTKASSDSEGNESGSASDISSAGSNVDTSSSQASKQQKPADAPPQAPPISTSLPSSKPVTGPRKLNKKKSSVGATAAESRPTQQSAKNGSSADLSKDVRGPKASATEKPDAPSGASSVDVVGEGTNSGNMSAAKKKKQRKQKAVKPVQASTPPNPIANISAAVSTPKAVPASQLIVPNGIVVSREVEKPSDPPKLDAESGAHSTQAADATRDEKRRFEPAFTPTVGNFWGHDDRFSGNRGRGGFRGRGGGMQRGGAFLGKGGGRGGGFVGNAAGPLGNRPSPVVQGQSLPAGSEPHATIVQPEKAAETTALPPARSTPAFFPDRAPVLEGQSDPTTKPWVHDKFDAAAQVGRPSRTPRKLHSTASTSNLGGKPHKVVESRRSFIIGDHLEVTITRESPATAEAQNANGENKSKPTQSFYAANHTHDEPNKADLHHPQPAAPAPRPLKRVPPPKPAEKLPANDVPVVPQEQLKEKPVVSEFSLQRQPSPSRPVPVPVLQGASAPLSRSVEVPPSSPPKRTADDAQPPSSSSPTPGTPLDDLLEPQRKTTSLPKKRTMKRAPYGPGMYDPNLPPQQHLPPAASQQQMLHQQHHHLQHQQHQQGGYYPAPQYYHPYPPQQHPFVMTDSGLYMPAPTEYPPPHLHQGPPGGGGFMYGGGVAPPPPPPQMYNGYPAGPPPPAGYGFYPPPPGNAAQGMYDYGYGGYGNGMMPAHPSQHMYYQAGYPQGRVGGGAGGGFEGGVTTRMGGQGEGIKDTE